MGLKVICPRCGCEKLEYYIENIHTDYYALDRYNEPTERCIKRGGISGTNAQGYRCKKCGELFGGVTGYSEAYKEIKD